MQLRRVKEGEPNSSEHQQNQERHANRRIDEIGKGRISVRQNKEKEMNAGEIMKQMLRELTI